MIFGVNVVEDLNSILVSGNPVTLLEIGVYFLNKKITIKKEVIKNSEENHEVGIYLIFVVVEVENEGILKDTNF